MALQNKYNFLRWDDGNPEAGLPPDLPHAYLFDRDRCTTAILAVPGELLAFYINNELGSLTYATFADLRLALVNSKGVVVNASAGPLQQHVISGSNYNVYAAFVIPAAADGLYRFQVKTVADTVLLTSNYFEVRNANYLNTSIYCKFRHDRYFFGLKYHQLTEFYQQFRINASEIDYQFESERETYKETTTGKRRTMKSDIDATSKVETYYFSREDHLAAGVMFEHDELYLNNKQYVNKGAYRISTDVRSKIAKGEIELYDQEISTANRCVG